jgi:hypothetical protein
MDGVIPVKSLSPLPSRRAEEFSSRDQISEVLGGAYVDLM